MDTLEQVLIERERNDERRWNDFKSVLSDMQKAHQLSVADLRLNLDDKINTANRNIAEGLTDHRREDDTLFGMINTRFWYVAYGVIGLLVSIVFGLVTVIWTQLPHH